MANLPTTGADTLRPAVLLILALSALPGCRDAEAAPRHEEAVAQVFAAFQRAVLDGNRNAFFNLVTPDLLEVAEHIDLAAIAKGRSEPLPVLGIERQTASMWHVVVADPVAPKHESTSGSFVVVRHGGKLLVDLVATAAATSGVVRHGADLETGSFELRDAKTMPGLNLGQPR